MSRLSPALFALLVVTASCSARDRSTTGETGEGAPSPAKTTNAAANDAEGAHAAVAAKVRSLQPFRHPTLALVAHGERSLTAVAMSKVANEIPDFRTTIADVPRETSAPLHLSERAHPELWLEVSPLDLQPGSSALSDGMLVTKGVGVGVDRVYAAVEGGVEEVRLLADASASTTMRYRVRAAAGLTVRLREGRVEAVDAAGFVHVASDPMFAVDAQGHHRSLNVSLGGDELIAELDARGLSYPIAMDPLWTTAPNPTFSHAAGARAFLTDGRLMVSSGSNGASGLTTATEIYNPATNAWSTAAACPTARQGDPGTVRIASGTYAGRILVIGGADISNGTILNVDMYDPVGNSWLSRAAIATSSPSLAVASGNKVLALHSVSGAGEYLVYNADTNAWGAVTIASGSFVTRRYQGVGSVTLADGRILSIAGFQGPTTITNVDIYDPSTNVLTNRTPIGFSTSYPSVTLLTPTKVLVAGGSARPSPSSAMSPIGSASVYDVTADTWTSTGSLVAVRSGHAAPLMPSGKVVIIGGVASVEQYDPATGIFTFVGTAPTIYGAPCQALPSGAVVLGGGSNFSNSYGVYTPNPLGTACVGGYECASGNCVNSVCCSTATCAVGATCNSPTKKGTCAKPLGITCSAAGECESGQCVDGVCCNSACGGQCQACNAAGLAGTCSTISGAVHGTRTACAGVGGATCGIQYCNGTDATACHYPAAGTTPCGAATCTASTETHTSTCNGAGACSDVPKSCGVYTCNATACKSSCTVGTDCVPGYFCDTGTSSCVPLAGLGKACSTTTPCGSGLFCTDGACCGLAACPSGSTCGAPGKEGTCTKKQGATCTTDGECATGSCADGRCCDNGCAGQCEACDVTGAEGTCTPVAGKPHGVRAACGSDPSNVCATATCDGSDRGKCSAFASSAIECRAQSCKGNKLTARAVCDGTGGCPTVTVSACDGYTCDDAGKACRTTCTTAAHCDPGLACEGGKCVKPSATCSADGTEVIDTAGVHQPCAPYLCKGGKCTSSCTGSDECTAPNVCSNGTCAPAVTETPPGGDAGSSGGCTFGGSPSSHRSSETGLGLVALGLALAFGARRRRVG